MNNAQTLLDNLLEQGAINQDQRQITLTEQHNSRLPVTRLLTELGFLSESQLREFMAHNLAHDSIELEHTLIPAEVLALIPETLARRHQLIPLHYQPQSMQLTLAMVNPANLLALDQINALLHHKYQLKPLLAAENDILASIERHYGLEQSIDGILNEIHPQQFDAQITANTELETSQPLVKLINAILQQAIQRGASDIHFEPEQNFLRIRYRLDGVLTQIRSLHKGLWPGMTVRLKVMANMDIAETRAPQDGRLSLRLAGRMIDFRMASHPTCHGENMVLRILDRQQGIVALAQLGLSEPGNAALQTMLEQPEGVILVTGPTGSGKTTTLYSLLNHLNTESVNIMTLEDPVEYPLAQIRQTSINQNIKLDFAQGIRSLLRQDPDILLVGEIRDQPTAEMTFRAAMTGHQVFATLHSNSALGALPRLLDLQVRPAILAANLNGIIAQRLVRRLCPECKSPYQPDPASKALLQLGTEQTPTLYQATGCEHCHQQGYRGRLALFELLPIDGSLAEFIGQSHSQRQLYQHARQQGFQPLAQDGIRRILQGQTSLAEVRRQVNLKQNRLH